MEFPAVLTVIPQHRAVEFQDGSASRRLVEPVNILGDDRPELSLLFQPGQFLVGCVGLCVQKEHFTAVKTVKFSRVLAVETVAQDGLRRIVVLLVVQAVHASEVRNTALRGHACPAEKHDIVMLLDNGF